MPPDQIPDGRVRQEEPQEGGRGRRGRHEVVAHVPRPQSVGGLVHVLHHREEHVGTDPARVRCICDRVCSTGQGGAISQKIVARSYFGQKKLTLPISDETKMVSQKLTMTILDETNLVSPQW